MPRILTGGVVVAVLALAASAARAEESKAGRGCPLTPGELTTHDDLSADAPGLAGLGGGAPTAVGAAGGAIATSTPVGLSDSEMGELEKLAAERPELAEQAGGYLTEEDLLTLILVLLIIIVVL